MDIDSPSGPDMDPDMDHGDTNASEAPETSLHETPHKYVPASDPPPQRQRRWLRNTALFSVAASVILASALIVLYFWASSADVQDAVRRRLVAELQQATGGKVEIAGFHWDLLHLRVEARGIVIHGTEGPGEAPYARVERLRLQVAILNLFTWGSSTRIILNEAEIQQPAFHLIVYPDGATNQPHPRYPRKPGKPVIDTLFDWQIGQLAIEQGSLHIADQVVPLNLQARDADLQLSWIPGGASEPDGSYRVAIGIGELAFAQQKFQPVSSRIDASLQLFHDSIRLDSMRLNALGQVLTLRGQLSNFTHPVWQTQANGQVDLRGLAPYTGFAYCRDGVVTLNATVKGQGSAFVMAGDLASNAIHYQDPVVDARTAAFSASFHADGRQLVVDNVKTRLAQGGEVDGEFQYDNWLDSTPKPAVQAALRRAHKSWPIPTGTVRATLDGVSLDTILIMLAAPEYRHLGLDTHVSGPATAHWTSFADDLEIGGQLAMTPSATPVPGEAPVQGSVDATYHYDSGSVKVRTLDARLPHSSLEGTGSLGVYPITRSSEMDLEFDTTDLSEFDGVLRTFGLQQGTRIGAAALPVLLKGEAKFNGQLNSSWLTPRVEGHLTAGNIALQIPASATDPKAPPQFVSWDSVDLDGLYTPESIVVRKSVLRRGSASLMLSGRLDATDPDYNLRDSAAEFDGNSMLSLKATASQAALADLLPLAGITTPITGKLNAQIDLRGQIKNLTGSGSIELDNVAAYGETIDRLHAIGTVSGQQIKVTSLTAQQSPGANGGSLTATGNYDLAHNSFQLDAHGSAIDLGSIQQLKRAGIGVTGKLGFTVAGDGLIRDPHLQARATFSKMTVAGEPVADLLVSASSHDHAVDYDLSSHQPAGQFSAHGVTSFDAGYTTRASLQFARFDVGALLKLLKVTGINGQSDLEGTATISGPLAQPKKLGGEASLKQFALVVEGVHLQSKGSVHAALRDGIARLDPVEITGEDTDLKLRGTLAVTGSQQLDLEANGAVNLRLAESLDPDLIASGSTAFSVEAHGPLAAPILQGKVEFQNAAIALQDFPNGLSQIKGTLEFNQNRLEVRSLTAQSGGGQLSVGGYIGFQHGLYADLSATGRSIRIRYPQGISSLADARLRLQGPQNNLLLSGNVQVTRFAINSDLDMAAFAAASSSVPPIVSPDAPSNHIRFDVHLTSAPQLNFQNAYAKLAGDVDLHLRGTLASPSLLGRISLTEGSTSIGGTKYELQRGDIYFNNPVRIQPNIDLDATARVEDYDITLGLHGTPEKLNVTYRSEPPLPEADVIALLTLGRTQDEQASYSQQQQQTGDNPTTDALLGGALNATVSNRVQRLFGTGAIKVDPNFIGSLGNSTARVTVVEQVGKNLTFTYASNVNTTSQQLIQAEIAINRHLSLLVTQDESGIFSVVLKNRRRFR
jgi:translocation and assembly module TamB